jgi:serine/threonine-protein kinase
MRPPHDAKSQPDPSPATGESPPTFLTSPPAAELSTCDVPLADTEAPAATSPSLPAPTGRYQLGEEIGRGGMGAVLRARDPHLDRELAVKVLWDGPAGPEALRRFVEEAQVCSQLQHPSIVPVHDLGTLPDGRPFFAMKLVKGRTLAALLQERAGPADDLPRFLTIFEQVCQAVAYAHSKGVLHRDLKPANVMVGAFGEVQVMDWGLAKVLRPQGGAAAEAGAASLIRTVRSAAGEESRAGLAMGTPAYMAPEQARGEVERLDERCDVFGLGAILCVVLTGKPPFLGDAIEAHARAICAELGDAFARLDGCGADAELVALAKRCLAAQAADRPRDGGAVAQAVTAYQRSVQERLRQAELGRARAQVQAAEERKRRRLTLALAAAVLLALLGVGVGAYWRQRQPARADLAVGGGLAQAELLAAQARAAPLQAERYRQAVEAARVAAQLAEGGSADVRQQAQGLLARLQEEEQEARKDRALLAELLEVRGPREGPQYRSDAQGMMLALAEPTADEQFAAAFRRWGLDVDGAAAAEAVAQLGARPAAVVAEVVAALDEWAGERRREGKPAAEWRRPAELAALLDDDPGSKRRELREVLARGRLRLERALDVLSAALRPVPVPVEVPLGPDRARLRELAEQTDPAAEPALGLLTLARALGEAGEGALAERLLRAAVVARPREVVLHHALGQLLADQDPPRWAEAVECFGAARVARPDLGVNLAEALRGSGRDGEGLALLARLVSERPASPYLHVQLAYALYHKGRLDEAVGHFQEAVRLDPKDATAHVRLGLALAVKGKPDEAIRHSEQALRIDPKPAWAHASLGAALQDKGKVDEAIRHYEEALRLDPKFAPAHVRLGIALAAKGQRDEAIRHYEAALRLDPKYAYAHVILGFALYEQGRADEAVGHFQEAVRLNPKFALARNSLAGVLAAEGRVDEAVGHFEQALRIDPKDAKAHYGLGAALAAKGRLDEAIRHYEQALRIDPKYADAHLNLGNALDDKGQLDEAISHYQQAIRLVPTYAEAHCNLGHVLRRQGRFEEALAALKRGHELGSKQPGWRYPSGQWVRDAERLVALDQKLPAVLRGEARPADPAEQLGLARLCALKKRHAAVARFYAEAFAAQPKLADDLQTQDRYNAACAAALAAAGQGEDARLLPDKVAGGLRRQALQWLKADLAAYAQLTERGNAATKQVIHQRLTHWRQDADLASVRDRAALDRLPEAERQAW